MHPHARNSEQSAPSVSDLFSNTPPAMPAPETLLEPTPEETREIFLLLKRLRRSRLLRQLGLGHPSGAWDIAPSLDSVPFLLNILRNPSDDHWRERTVAAWSLGRGPIPPEQKPAVAQRLHDVLENRQLSPGDRFLKRFIRAGIRSSWLAFPLVLLSGFILLSLDLDNVHLWLAELLYVSPLAILILTPAMFPFSLSLDIVRANLLRATAAMALGRLGALESIGALAKASLDSSGRVSSAASAALFALLPALTPDHYGQLSADAVPNLCRVLTYLESSRFQDASDKMSLHVLEALGKVGDGRAVPSVQRMAERGRTARLREAAAAILPALLERQRHENEREMLLRGASQPPVMHDQLLRPATADLQTTAPELLLRPVPVAPPIPNAQRPTSLRPPVSVAPDSETPFDLSPDSDVLPDRGKPALTHKRVL